MKLLEPRYRLTKYFSVALLIIIIVGALFILLIVNRDVGDELAYLSSEEKEWLLENSDSINVLFGYEDPPQAYTDLNGNYTGVFVDIFRLIEDRLDIEIKMQMFDEWNDIIDYASTARNFIIVGITPTQKRMDFLNFTNVIFSRPHVIVSRENETYESLEDLKDMKVCTVKGYVVNDYLWALDPELDITPVKNNLEGLTDVSGGKYDAMITSQAYAIYYIQNNELINLKITGDTGISVDIAVACSNEDVILSSIMRKTVEHIDESEINEQIRKWLIYDGKSPENFRTTLIVLIFIIMFISTGILIVIIWLIILRKTVEKQTAKISRSVDEKDILIKEIYHRVKNNFNIMSALISIRSDLFETSSETAEVLSNLNGRITSMALIHQQLYESNDLTQINIGEYLRLLKVQLLLVHKEYAEYKINISTDGLSLGINDAVPCVLLINEIMQILLRHIDAKTEGYELIVGIKKTVEGKIEIAISDNGIDIQSYPKLSENEFSMMLIKKLSEQLKSQYQIEYNKGNCFRIIF